jgi:hypothetical protein
VPNYGGVGDAERVDDVTEWRDGHHLVLHHHALVPAELRMQGHADGVVA